MKSILAGIGYAAAILIFYMYRNEIVSWLQNGEAPLALIFLIAVGFILFPVIPFKIIIGMLGYFYGSLLGALISWLAASVGSVIIYLLVQIFFQKQGRAYLAKFNKLERLTQTIEHHPFWTIVFARMIPVLPQALVNVYSALLSIRLLTYAVASAVGKIPAMLVYAYIGEHLFSGVYKLLMAIGIYALFLLVTYLIYRRWVHNKRRKA
ncbi:TVP38/TMEM64 family protein [Paenibacillus radicis (ex Xue et al. 2023)]|uniref:TVP38/TMEM64 family membrane protein n=1 Tax=Paenibacillus radicis (ex Xue et al. 2023) TaxID=2972489 RepID=A0ABT1YCN6_9BACL|nr:VTT domain-containing protein [Paenibacillus radicis (ex Xue et al. 2023)]MCR8630970.1 VTT domain-containing protein [Paenibacillus radicis (ex Xue et al. 2023)]